MTEEARLYGTVLYELKVPQEMVKKTGEILERNPELVRVLQSPVYRREKKHAIIEEIWENTGVFQCDDQISEKSL